MGVVLEEAEDDTAAVPACGLASPGGCFQVAGQCHLLSVTTCPLWNSSSIKMLESQEKMAEDLTLVPAFDREWGPILASQPSHLAHNLPLKHKN